MLLGLVLRFANLTHKAVWTDEFASMVFSLGNSFRTVPLDQVISFSDLLAPLRPNPANTLHDVAQSLLTESNHPPLYFFLTHLWLQLFPPTQAGWVSVWAMRSLPALCGVLTIPAMFGLGWLAFRSWVVAHLAAALMAVSPFGVYLGQEARHYTLPGLWVIASLACFVRVVQILQQRRSLPPWLCLIWVGVNALGIATHYFVAITLMAECFVLGAIALQHWQKDGCLKATAWKWVGVAIAGTVVSALGWLPIIQNVQDSALTDWITLPHRTGWLWIEPLARILASILTMLYLLPVQAEFEGLMWPSVIGLLMLLGWTMPKLYQGIRSSLQQPQQQFPLAVLGGFLAGAIALFLGSAYLLDRDLTLAFRYSFVYYPVVVLLLAAALASVWERRWQPPQSTTWANYRSALRYSFVAPVLAWSLVGALVVVTDLGFLKTHQPAQVVRWMHDPFPNTLIATAHHTHGQTGRLMGLALEWQRQMPNAPTPQFLLAHQSRDRPNDILNTLIPALANLPRPFDLWLVNFKPISEEALEQTLSQQTCRVDTKPRRAEGYSFRRYRCQ